jgi:hypothetical protein
MEEASLTLPIDSEDLMNARMDFQILLMLAGYGLTYFGLDARFIAVFLIFPCT